MSNLENSIICELKPCPFCGGKATKYKHSTSWNHHPDCYLEHDEDHPEMDKSIPLIEKWDHRPSEDKLILKIDKIKSVYEKHHLSGPFDKSVSLEDLSEATLSDIVESLNITLELAIVIKEVAEG